jgi:type III pantothenate kinase
MNLCVDIGNSRLKWAQGEPPGWTVRSAALAGLDPGDLYAILWNRLVPPTRLLVSCVARTEWSETLRHWARAHWGCEAELLQASAAAGGVRNRYRDPARLGIDRWAALVGARRLTNGPAIVIDAGTAVTVDALGADGEFLGGVILAGLELQRAGLRHGTAGIGVTEERATGCLALDTDEAVTAGTRYGLAGGIERIIREQSGALGGTPVILITGGDAERLLPLLPSGVRHVPDLVLLGVHALGAAPC